MTIAEDQCGVGPDWNRRHSGAFPYKEPVRGISKAGPDEKDRPLGWVAAMWPWSDRGRVDADDLDGRASAGHGGNTGNPFVGMQAAAPRTVPNVVNVDGAQRSLLVDRRRSRAEHPARSGGRLPWPQQFQRAGAIVLRSGTAYDTAYRVRLSHRAADRGVADLGTALATPPASFAITSCSIPSCSGWRDCTASISAAYSPSAIPRRRSSIISRARAAGGCGASPPLRAISAPRAATARSRLCCSTAQRTHLVSISRGEAVRDRLLTVNNLRGRPEPLPSGDLNCVRHGAADALYPVVWCAHGRTTTRRQLLPSSMAARGRHAHRGYFSPRRRENADVRDSARTAEFGWPERTPYVHPEIFSPISAFSSPAAARVLARACPDASWNWGVGGDLRPLPERAR